MGLILEMPPEAGEYSVEIRDESFYLQGEHTYVQVGEEYCRECHRAGKLVFAHQKQTHAIYLYPASEEVNQGSVEILIEDIPKIRAALDAVEQYVKENR